MKPALLERERELGELARLLEGLQDEKHGKESAPSGRVVLIGGEAGVGKTALVRAFAAASKGARVLWGACEALFTPRALGPLHDVALEIGGPIAELLAGASATRPALFGAVLAELGRAEPPTVLVVEDVHWADEATLDLLKYLGRRIGGARALLVLTYRDDELTAGHPLRTLLGDLPRDTCHRLRLAPLSRGAVETLARAAGRSAAELHERTGGNPFFVTEVLASSEERVPPTVRDAVLARAARLSAGAREVLELAALAPGSIEQSLLTAVLGERRAEIEACAAAGLLRSERRGLAFRHELARLAVEAATDAGRRAEGHRRILRELERALERDGTGLSRAVYHAEEAGDASALLALAPRAAERAAALGAHREAAAHYARALRHAEQLSAEERAELHERRSYECYLTSAIAEALESRLQALALWRGLGRREREGDSLRWASRLFWFLGRKADAEEHGLAAVLALEPLGESRELALAYSNRAQLAMLEDDAEAAVERGARAIELAERLGDTEVLAHALNNVGTARWTSDPARGRAELTRSLELAAAAGLEEHVARAYTNLASSAVRTREYELAERALESGLAYAGERDLDAWTLYMRAWRARLALERGRFDVAADDAESLLAREDLVAITRIPALTVLGRLRARRGDPGADELLAEAHALAGATREPQRILPVALARAEAAWLAGEPERSRAAAAEGLAALAGRDDPWTRGELAVWIARAGGSAGEGESARAKLAEPWRCELAGDATRAAAAWERLGCPYERALALAQGGEPELRAALEGLRALGATRAQKLVERRLRELGARDIPRGERPTTRANPAGLTAREVEVLGLLARGLANKEIARTLSVSPKTVDHHVSAILAKLGVRSRARAAARARELGFLHE